MRPSAEEEATSLQSLKILSAEDIINEQPPPDVVEGIFTQGCTTTIVAESGTGKTFLTLSISAAISGGKPWVGRAVTQGSVVLVHFEGDALGKRVAVLKQEGGDISNLYILRAKGTLSPQVERASLVEHAAELEKAVAKELSGLRETLRASGRPPVVLVVFDTLRASMSGSEDSSENVSAYIRAVQRLGATAAEIPPALGLVHHAGWAQEGKALRERGSSALRGNVDNVVVLAAGKDDAALKALGAFPLFLNTPKLRDEEKPESLALIRRKVYLDGVEDTHGRPVSSCIIEEAEPAAVRQARHLLLTLAEHPALSSKEDVAKLLGVSKALVVEMFAFALENEWVEPTTQRKPYQLTAKGLLVLDIPAIQTL